MPIRARADRSLALAGARSRRVVRVDATAPEAAPEAEAVKAKAAEELRSCADEHRRLEAMTDRLGPEAAKLSREMDHIAKILINTGFSCLADWRTVRGVTVMKSPLRTMTTSREDLLADLEEAARAYRAAPRRAFGGFPDLLAEWPLPDPRNAREPLTALDELLVAREARACWKPDRIPVTVVFTPRPLADGAPWHWDWNWCVAIASTAGLCVPGGVSPAAFVAYQTFLQGLRERGIAPHEMMHAEARGCLYDPCTTRVGLERALRTASFCDECRGALERVGLYPEPALSIAGVIYSIADVDTGIVN